MSENTDTKSFAQMYIRDVARSIAKSEKAKIAIKWVQVVGENQADAMLTVGDLQVGTLIADQQILIYSVDGLSVDKLPKKYQSPFIRIDQERLCFQRSTEKAPDSQSLHTFFAALSNLRREPAAEEPEPSPQWVQDNGAYRLVGGAIAASIVQDKPVHVVVDGRERPKMVQGLVEDVRKDKKFFAKGGVLLPIWQLKVGEDQESMKIVYLDDAESGMLYANQLPSLQANGPAT